MSDSVCEIMLPLRRKRIKLTKSENEDRLSDLPEGVILHMLSFLNTKHAVQTCVLSKRWKDLWKHIPALILHSSDFPYYLKFNRLMSRVLSQRDSSIALQALDFKCSFGSFEPYLKKIVIYALSHNVERLGLCFNGDYAQIPSTVFSCQTLTHLKLSIYYDRRGHETQFPKSLNLPSLTNLQIGNFEFDAGDNDCAEQFSTFNRLKSLHICNCVVRDGKTLFISSVTLVNLTIYNHRSDYYKFDLCTPSLCKFVFIGTPHQSLSGSNVSSLELVDIEAAEVKAYEKELSVFLLSSLIELANIKSLTVTTTTLQVLSLVPDVLKIKLPSLHNLKSLKVKMKKLSYRFRKTLKDVKLQKAKSEREATRIRKAFKARLEPSPVPDGIVDFLRQNSPLVEVDYIDWKR